MPGTSSKHLLERRQRRHRSKRAGGAGIVGFLAGAFLAGQLMIRPGMFNPGVTAEVTILNDWPGFPIGGAACGFLAPDGRGWPRLR